MPIGTHCHLREPQEVSHVSFPLPLRPLTRTPLARRLQQASARGALGLGKRLHALRALAEAMRVREGAALGGVGAHTVRDYRRLLLGQPRARCTDKRPPGRIYMKLSVDSLHQCEGCVVCCPTVSEDVRRGVSLS